MKEEQDKIIVDTDGKIAEQLIQDVENMSDKEKDDYFTSFGKFLTGG